jgi:hypothetical protein
VGRSDKWNEFSAARQDRSVVPPVQSGYNPTTSKSGAQLRGKASQVWEAGNMVDVGLVKDLLIASKNEDGAFSLLSKPDKNGQSKSYEFKPHEGLSKGASVDFMEATAGLSKDRELAQIKRGKITLRDGNAKPVITLFKDANASTFIHETGHHWLEELMKDSQHAKAPAGFCADANSVLKWLGVKQASTSRPAITSSSPAGSSAT